VVGSWLDRGWIVVGTILANALYRFYNMFIARLYNLYTVLILVYCLYIMFI
jgi:hypothetical protein